MPGKIKLKLLATIRITKATKNSHGALIFQKAPRDLGDHRLLVLWSTNRETRAYGDGGNT